MSERVTTVSHGEGDGAWRRRASGLAAAVLLVVTGGWPTVTAGPTRPAAGRTGSGEERREARRRWALARMDEVAQDRLRCAERFRKTEQVHECQRALDRQFRRYNEIYLEAAREAAGGLTR